MTVEQEQLCNGVYIQTVALKDQIYKLKKHAEAIEHPHLKDRVQASLATIWSELEQLQQTVKQSQ